MGDPPPTGLEARTCPDVKEAVHGRAAHDRVRLSALGPHTDRIGVGGGVSAQRLALQPPWAQPCVLAGATL